MKTSSKFINQSSRYFFAASLSLLLIAPGTKAASNANGDAAKALQTSTVCSRVLSFGTQSLTSITSREAKLTSDWSADTAKRQQAEQTFDAKVSTDRAHWDSSRTTNFAKLTADAKTSIQQQAVTTYEQTVLAAVATRRSTVDKARDTYRVAITSAASSRRGAITQAAGTFQSAVNTAITTAQASCSSGATGSTIRTSFMASLKTARTTFTSSVGSAPQTTGLAQQAAATRTAAVKQADDTFAQAVQSAVTALKAALGQQ
jgi:hypothetical protein